MQVIIDLDSHSAIQSFTNRSPAGVYQFKSQDTVEWEIYFVQNGLVQDLGAGFALKFGMIKTGDTAIPPTLLAYQTTFNYLTDVNSNTYYSGLVNFNTSQMATAIGTSPSIQGTAEIRYQDSLNEIIHTINISTIVYATILVETGVTPPGVSAGYPDASTIELLVHKNANNGYAGLTSGAKLISSTIPVDNQTVKIDTNGNIASSRILAKTTSNFTTPSVNANVTIIVDSTTSIKPSSFVYIPGAGYYIVLSITDSTHCVISNNGDPFNAASGVTISSGTVVLPAQAAAGGGGGAGRDAFSNLIENFVVPAVGATVTIRMGDTSWLPGSGYVIFIQSAGYYSVSSISVLDTQYATVNNLGYTSTNAAPGTTIMNGVAISPGGVQGPAATGAAGSGAYDATTANFTMPAAGSNVNVAINNTAWLGVGQEIFIQSAGYFSVNSITSPTIFVATNSNYPGAAAPGATISAGVKVSPAGVQGPQGAGGPGLNAYTTLTSSFTQPTAGLTVTIVVGSTSWMSVGLGLYIAGGGYYTVSSIGDLTHVTVTNSGIVGNALSGTTVTGSGTQNVTPSGTPGTTGINAFTLTTSNFTAPAAGSTVTVSVAQTSWTNIGQIVYISGAGYYQIAAIVSGTQLSLTNLAGYGNAVAGTTVPNGSTVSPAGPIGPAGPPGSQGAAGRDGAYATVYTDKSVSGNGGVASPVVLVNDIAQGLSPGYVYQRDLSGNSLWSTVPVDGTTMTTTGVGNQLKSIPPQENLSCHIETPTAKSYTIDLAAATAYTIKTVKVTVVSGSCTLALQKNGTNVTGGGSISVTSSLNSVGINQTVALNDKITILLSALSSPVDLQFSLIIQR